MVGPRFIEGNGPASDPDVHRQRGGAGMATLTVWKFDSTSGAENALALLERMQKEELVQVNDAAYVYWQEGRKKPKTEQLHHMGSAGALGGSFWGLLFGLIFFVPLLGMAVGAAMGAWAGSMTDVGIDDTFIKEVRRNVTPGTSALFVMTSAAVADKVIEEFKDTGASLVSTNLSKEQEAKLREAFAEAEQSVGDARADRGQRSRCARAFRRHGSRGTGPAGCGHGLVSPRRRGGASPGTARQRERRAGVLRRRERFPSARTGHSARRSGPPSNRTS